MGAQKQSLFINRELSWLEFNQRVLECAGDPGIPVIERLKFLAITASNLDEFFMVRVGGLSMVHKEGIKKKDFAGMTPLQQLTSINHRVQKMVADQYAAYKHSIIPELAENDIEFVSPSELNATQHKRCEYLFENEIFPMLSPVVLSPDRPVPLFTNRTLYYLIRFQEGKRSESAYQMALLHIPRNLDRFITLPSKKGLRLFLVEELIAMYMNQLFPGAVIRERVLFRITRNADLRVHEDLNSDLLTEMEAVLEARHRSDCVRLEISESATRLAATYLRNALGISSPEVYDIVGPHDFSSFMTFASLPECDHLKYKTWQPQLSPDLPKDKPILENISQHDIVLYHPYESFEPVTRLLKEAANDPEVIAIKQTLYRTSKSSPIISALKRAAENGKAVTVLVELKARFDEEQNIEWARQLEDAGVQVIYGIKGLKTHAKICIIIRKESQGIRRYLHFGTGNYNEKTATLYSDVSYMTTDEDLGYDASSFFNIITGYSRPQKYRKMESAPLGLRDKLLALIKDEIQRKKDGQKAYIILKVNSLVDPAIIKALYKASQAGIPIELNIRGICCLRPGIKGVSKTITVKSIVDRFLEHSRIFYFYHGGEERVLISSADLMQRNLDKRIEQLVPVDDTRCKNKIIAILKTHMADTVNAWLLQPDGSYQRIIKKKEKKRVRSQEVLYKNICTALADIKKNQPIAFEPYWSPKTSQ